MMIAPYGPETWTEPTPRALTQTSDAKPTELSAWKEAVRLGQVRERLRSRRLDASVRVIAKETGSSAGRAGDLLHIYDSFPDADLLMLGLRTMPSDPSSDADLDEDLDAELRRRAETILKRLSFRTLRRVSRLTDSFSRRAELIRITAEAQQP
jgi:hypothetical protein